MTKHVEAIEIGGAPKTYGVRVLYTDWPKTKFLKIEGAWGSLPLGRLFQNNLQILCGTV